MIPPLTLIRTNSPAITVSAGWLASSDAVEWLREMAHCRAQGCHVSIYPVARSTSDPRAAGILLIPRSGTPQFRARVQPLTEILPGVYAPCDSTLSATLLENERRYFFPYQIHFFHPSLGLIGFDPKDELSPALLLERPRECGNRWNLAMPVERFAPVFHSIRIQFPSDPQEMLDQAAKEIGDQQGKLSKQNNGIGKQAELLGKGLIGAMLLGTGWAIIGIAKVAGSLIGSSDARNASTSPGSLDKLRQWAEKNWQHLLDSRKREIDRLLNLMENDPDQGLRYAIPLTGIEQSRGVAAPTWKLSHNKTQFSLGHGGGAISSWDIGNEAQLKLERQYREAALREIALGRHERAAYIFGNLLGDWNKAAKALADAGKLREAVAIYLHKLHNSKAAADCLERAGHLLQAAAIYAEAKEFEKAADLHARVGNEVMARELWQSAVEAQRDPLEKARILSDKLHDDAIALALLDDTWRKGIRPEPALKAMFAIHRKNANETQAQELLTRMFEQDVSTFSLPEKLHCGLQEVACWNSPALDQELEHQAYRRIGQALSDQTKDSAKLLSFLPKLHPTDVILSRDAQRYSSHKNPPKLQYSGPPRGKISPALIVPVSQHVRWDSIDTIPKGVSIAGYGTEMLTVAQLRDNSCHSSALKTSDDPGNTEVRHIALCSSRGTSRLFHFPEHKRLHYRSLDRARSSNDDALGNLRNILAAGHYGSNGDFALLEFTATSSLALHIYSETANLMRSFPIDLAPPEVRDLDWHIAGKLEHICLAAAGFLVWRYPDGQFSNVNLGETPSSLHVSPNPNTHEALITMSGEVLLLDFNKATRAAETINLHSGSQHPPVACYLPDGSIVIAYSGGGVIYPSNDRINACAQLSYPTDVGKPIGTAARGNGGFAILTDQGKLLVYAR